MFPITTEKSPLTFDKFVSQFSKLNHLKRTKTNLYQSATLDRQFYIGHVEDTITQEPEVFFMRNAPADNPFFPIIYHVSHVKHDSREAYDEFYIIEIEKLKPVRKNELTPDSLRMYNILMFMDNTSFDDTTLNFFKNDSSHQPYFKEVFSYLLKMTNKFNVRYLHNSDYLMMRENGQLVIVNPVHKFV